VPRLLPQVLMDAEVLALAVMTDLLSGDQRRRYTDMIDSPYMPALRAPVPLSHVDRPKKLPTAPQVCQASTCIPVHLASNLYAVRHLQTWVGMNQSKSDWGVVGEPIKVRLGCCWCFTSCERDQALHV
jgi:hypothetical protein